MPGANNATDRARAISTHFPFRRTIVAVETLVGAGGLAGSIQLLAGVVTLHVSADWYIFEPVDRDYRLAVRRTLAYGAYHEPRQPGAAPHSLRRG
jgi:hypothetical protein